MQDLYLLHYCENKLLLDYYFLASLIISKEFNGLYFNQKVSPFQGHCYVSNVSYFQDFLLFFNCYR